MKLITSLILLVTIALIACNPYDLPEDVPSCIKNLVKKKEPLEVWQYTSDGELVYLIVPDCCDQYSTLYSADCDRICAPSGGLTGKGDGQCSDFFQQAKDQVLLWKKE